MKILHATNSAEETTLGIEQEVASLAIAQKARGHEVVIVINRPGIFTEACRQCGVPVTVIDNLRHPLRRPVATTPAENAALEEAVREFIPLLEESGPDVIHCHSGGTMLVAMGAGNRMNIPCVVTGDSPMIAFDGLAKGLKFATLCLTEVAFKALLKSDVPDSDVYYVPLGCPAVPPKQAQQKGPDGAVNLIATGSLDPRKGIDVLILGMFELRRRLGRACPVLNIYGDGPVRKYLTEMTTVLGLQDTVRFHGFQHGALEQCPTSDILVMTSRAETGPLVVLEAMSRGMPIVATAVGEVANMLPDQRYGRVIPPDSVIALADAIESLLTDIACGRFNPDLPIGRYRSFYSVEKYADRVEAAYNRILLGTSVAARRAG